jgi:hypothetical protein
MTQSEQNKESPSRSTVLTPLLMGLLFYGLVTPVGALMRVFGKDLLRLRRDTAAPSYWILRPPPGPSRDSMTRQS